MAQLYQASDGSGYFIILSEVAQSHKPGFCEFLKMTFLLCQIWLHQEMLMKGVLCRNFKQKGVPTAWN